MKKSPDSAATRQAEVDDREFIGTILDIFEGPFAMLTACLDESQNGPIFCVSGVLLGRKGLRALHREWSRELRLANLSYYHAVDCAHGLEEFEGMDKDRRMSLHKRMSQLIAKHALGSTTVVKLPWHFSFKKSDWGYSEYTACAFLCMNEMFDLADRFGLPRKISFFIEDGHPTEGELRNLISSRWKAAWGDGMVSYAFTGKLGYRAVQAADVVAYEVCKRFEEKSREPHKPTEKSMRKSLQAIITGDNHRGQWLDEGQRKKFAKLAGMEYVPPV